MRIISRFAARLLIFICLFVAVQAAHAAEKITIAAAADLKFALDEIVVLFSKAHPADHVETIYGSSGKFQAQIRQGAPFDLYFSADIAYPRALKEEGFAASEVQPYAVGRIVLWSTSRDAAKMTLADPAIRKIAIANPKHAPYGKRAEEALKAAGVWEKVEGKLVYGENVRHALQFLQTGAADAGILARSVADAPEIEWAPVDPALHAPLDQVAAVVRRSPRPGLGLAFIQFVTGAAGRPVLRRYGFRMPGEL